MQLTAVLFLATATLVAAESATTPAHVLGRSPLFMMARQDDTTCQDQNGSGWDYCAGAALCFNEGTGATCCSDGSGVCQPGTTCIGGGVCQNDSTPQGNDGARAVAPAALLGLIVIGFGMCVAL